MFSPKPATTWEMLSFVGLLLKHKIIDSAEYYEVCNALRNGELIRPHWEEYGFKVRSNGTPSIIEDNGLLYKL